MTKVNSSNIETLTDTQQRIVDAALDLVSHVGYKSTTTKMIAQNAAVNETTIFKNFSSKESLLDIAFKQHSSQIIDEVNIFFDQNFLNTEDVIRKAGLFIVSVYERHRDIVIGSIKEVGNSQIKSIFKYKQEYIQGSLSNKLKQFSENHHFNDHDYEVISYIFNSAIVSILIDKTRQQHGDEDSEDLRINYEDIIDFTVKAFH